MTTTTCPPWCTGHERSVNHFGPATRLQAPSGITRITPSINAVDGRVAVIVSGYGAKDHGIALLPPSDAADLGRALIASGRDPEFGQALVTAAAVLIEERRPA